METSLLSTRNYKLAEYYAIQISVGMIVAEDIIHELLKEETVTRKADLLCAIEKLTKLNKVIRKGGKQEYEQHTEDLYNVADAMQSYVTAIENRIHSELIKNVEYRYCSAIAKYTTAMVVLESVNNYQKMLNRGTRNTVINETINHMLSFSGHMDCETLNDGFQLKCEIAVNEAKLYGDAVHRNIMKTFYEHNNSK